LLSKMVDINMESLPVCISGMNLSEMEDLAVRLGEPAYRAKQLRTGVYRGLALSFEEMTDLPAGFRQRLAGEVRLHGLASAHLLTGRDGTVKALFSLRDGRTVESALMYYGSKTGGRRISVCVSTQVGCAVGCPFCATGRQGFERNLGPDEIIDQVLFFARYLRDNGDERLTNIVFMGMGEPLANYASLMQAISILNSPDGFGLGARNMTISTAGLVPQIARLGREKLQVGLAVSLHASDNNLRDRLVPLNRKYPLEKLIPACREYYRATGRRVSFEYVIFRDINDSVAQARSLAGLLQGLNCHVNLIPANESPSRSFQPPLRQAVLAFSRQLRQLNINATLRQPRGQDIEAGCGQLRSRLKQNGGTVPAHA
jgi:23S rRNA (adenine2503-C2)-methyltransferase